MKFKPWWIVKKRAPICVLFIVKGCKEEIIQSRETKDSEFCQNSQSSEVLKVAAGLAKPASVRAQIKDGSANIMELLISAFLPWSNGWVALSFLVRRLFVCPAMVTPDQISTLFNIYRHKSVVLTQFHLISSSTKLHWPSTTKYQPVPPHTDPVPPNTNQHRLLLSQYYHVSTSSASY